MAWQYSDWVTVTTASSRLAQLRLHIQEVSNALTAGYQSDGTSYNPSHLRQYLQDLHKMETPLANSASGNRVARTRQRGMR